MGLRGGWGACSMKLIQHFYGFRKNKKTQAKRPLIECDSDNDEPYPRFIILESKEQPPLTKTSPFVIEKSISALITPNIVKNLKNGTIPIEVTEKKQAEIILKQKKIHNIDIKA